MTLTKGMSVRELMALKESVDRALVEKRAEKSAAVEDLRNRFTAEISRLGLTVHQVFGKGSALRGRKLSPRYRDPSNPSRTWAGRGFMPVWLRVATGGEPAELAKYRVSPNGAEGS